MRWLGLTFLLAMGCQAAEPAPASKDDDFAVLPASATLSVLPAIENTNGKPAVCIGLIGFEEAARESARTALTALVTDAARQWISLLAGNEQWSLRSPVTPAFAVQDTECPIGLPGFAVNLWATPEGFKADYCSRPNYTCASGAINAYRSLYLGPWNRDAPDDPLNPFVVLHELGHLLGLGDTYRIPGANDWNGVQPPSVMNGESATLTDDDKLGLWVVLRALKTGHRSCDGFGAEVPMTANAWDAIMCDPSAKPADNHGPHVPPAMMFPQAGTWRYTGFDVAADAMRIRAVAPTQSGYSMRVAAVSNGQASPVESVYVCGVDGACAAQEDAQYRILVATPTSLRMINPSVPAGIQVDFVGP